VKLRKNKIREALVTNSCFGAMKTRIAALTDDEMAEAERIERMGKRRENLMRIFRSERYRRAGRGEKMLTLQVVTNL
jgi:hypothetical protein